MKVVRAEQPDQADDDQIQRDDIVEQARHDQDQNARDQRYQGSERQSDVHGVILSLGKAMGDVPGFGCRRSRARHLHQRYLRRTRGGLSTLPYIGATIAEEGGPGPAAAPRVAARRAYQLACISPESSTRVPFPADLTARTRARATRTASMAR